MKKCTEWKTLKKHAFIIIIIIIIITIIIQIDVDLKCWVFV